MLSFRTHYVVKMTTFVKCNSLIMRYIDISSFYLIYVPIMYGVHSDIFNTCSSNFSDIVFLSESPTIRLYPLSRFSLSKGYASRVREQMAIYACNSVSFT